MTQREALIELRDKVKAGEAVIARDVSRIWPNGYAHAVNAGSGSLDAAKALHEAVLPGWRWIVRNGDAEDAEINYPDGGPDKFFANVWASGNPNFGAEHFTAWSSAPSRALLLAILDALITEAAE